MAQGIEVGPVKEEEFFRRFLAPSDDGELLAARDESGLIRGYAPSTGTSPRSRRWRRC